jgi:hypothetical protein
MIRAAVRVIHHTSKITHHLLLAATGIVLLVSLMVLAAAWRLSQGPIELAWLSDQMKAVAADDAFPVRISFDRVVLAWEGFEKGVDYPLDLQVTKIKITDPAANQMISAPKAKLTLSIAALMTGRFVPRTLEVDHAKIVVERGKDGAISFGDGVMATPGSSDEPTDLAALRDQLAHPAASDRVQNGGLLDQLQRVHFHDAEISVVARKTDLVLQANRLDLEFRRSKNGQVSGRLSGLLTAGDQSGDLSANLDIGPEGITSVAIKLAPFQPAGIGSMPAALAITAPVSLEATLRFDRTLSLQSGRATFNVGSGLIPIGNGQFPVQNGIVEVSGTPFLLSVDKASFDISRPESDKTETISAVGSIGRVADRITAGLTINVSAIEIADLPRLWPAGMAENVRDWILQNVTGGLVPNGSVKAAIEADDMFQEVVLTAATGDLEVANGTFTWIDHLPPVEQTYAHLHLVDPDTLDIHILAARQSMRNGGADLLIRDGLMRITGLSHKDQFADISAVVEGAVPSAWALLMEPRLRLLSAHPIGLKPVAGDVTGDLRFQFPLEKHLQIDDVRIRVDGDVKRLRLEDIAGGRDFDDGAIDLDITKDGLNLKGRGVIATIPVSLSGTMDFTNGPTDQILEKIVATARPDAAQLEAAGLQISSVVSGEIPLTAVLTERRNGNGSLTLESDLTPTTLLIGPLGWNKQPGGAATANATMLLVHDRITKVDHISVKGDGLVVAGSADFANGQIRTILLDRVRLGRTEVHGAVHLAAMKPISVVLRGSRIDLAPKLMQKSDGTLAPDGPLTPAWTIDGRFDHLLLAHGIEARDLLIAATGDGETIQTLDIIGATSGTGGFSIKIEPDAGKRHLHVVARDAGDFLQGIDAVHSVKSGYMSIDGTFEQPVGYRPLVGTATISDVTVKSSPVLGKLLQAITLYGLVDALRGPGMNFSRITVPFRYDGINLQLNQARAYNSSLGLTAKGSIALASEQSSITGTIVPAYFFNAMLGRLPIVGRLFSPEQGGGLFAARFGLEGPLDDPTISLNPVSALAPGFLRKIFGVFDNAGANPAETH